MISILGAPVDEQDNYCDVLLLWKNKAERFPMKYMRMRGERKEKVALMFMFMFMGLVVTKLEIYMLIYLPSLSSPIACLPCQKKSLSPRLFFLLVVCCCSNLRMNFGGEWHAYNCLPCPCCSIVIIILDMDQAENVYGICKEMKLCVCQCESGKSWTSWQYLCVRVCRVLSFVMSEAVHT